MSKKLFLIPILLIGLYLIACFFGPIAYKGEQETKIDGSYPLVYLFLNDIRDWPKWYSWSKTDPSLKAWASFSEPMYDDWLQLSIPIYLAYGTEDRTSDLCDIVPFFFIREKKDNLTLKRYLRLEHNFFEVDAQGRANYEKGHWESVMNGFLEWIK